MLEYRGRLMSQAAKNAKIPLWAGEPAREGLKFPWQSAIAGVEQDIGNNEDHLQGAETAFLRCHFRLKIGHWPRQARDRHRKG